MTNLTKWCIKHWTRSFQMQNPLFCVHQCLGDWSLKDLSGNCRYMLSRTQNVTKNHQIMVDFPHSLRFMNTNFLFALNMHKFLKNLKIIIIGGILSQCSHRNNLWTILAHNSHCVDRQTNRPNTTKDEFFGRSRGGV